MIEQYDLSPRKTSIFTNSLLVNTGAVSTDAALLGYVRSFARHLQPIIAASVDTSAIHDVQSSEQKTEVVPHYIQMEHHSFFFCHIYNVYNQNDLKLVVQ